jgi:hypothetical protein
MTNANYRPYYRPLRSMPSAIGQQDQANHLSDIFAFQSSQAFQDAKAKQAASLPEKVTQEGVYHGHNGVYYRVKATLAGKLWPHVITKTETGVEFTFSRDGFNHIEPKDRLTVEEVNALGLLFGRCVLCGKELTVKKSVLQGLGPICAKKY